MNEEHLQVSPPLCVSVSARSFLQLHSPWGMWEFVRSQNLMATAQVAVVRLSSLLVGNEYLPSVEWVFTQLRRRIDQGNAGGRFVYVYGLEPLLTLWNGQNRHRCLFQLRHLLDDVSLHACVLLCLRPEELRQEAFANPRYEERIRVVGEPTGWEAFRDLELSVQDRSLATFYHQELVFATLRLYVETYEGGQRLKEPDAQVEDGTQSACRGVIFLDGQFPKANFDPCIAQVSSFRDYLGRLCRQQRLPLSDEALDWLRRRLGTGSRPFEQVLQEDFGEEPAELPSRVVETFLRAMPEAREVYLWYLRQTVQPVQAPYLHAVLHVPETSADNFLDTYVCYPHKLMVQPGLSEPWLDVCAKERQKALMPVMEHLTTSLTRFLDQLKTAGWGEALRWLRNNTLYERQDLIRRVMRDGYSADVLMRLQEVYPLLADYLAGYDFPQRRQLVSYFTDYRRQKLCDQLEAPFVARAAEVTYPCQGIPMRRELLKQYGAKPDSYLIAVDALGVEYLPLLQSWATRKQQQATFQATFQTAFAQLPTSTPFNTLEWPDASRRLDIKCLDEAIHHGAPSHQDSGPASDMVQELEAFREAILDAIERALARHRLVIVTSDHGASRLAVLAHRQGLEAKLELPAGAHPDDWRYCRVLPGEPPPTGTVEENGYWVVKGYARFSKSGGKNWGLHGGLTWEEALVPFIVFRCEGAELMPEAPASKGMVVNDDLDI